MPNRTLKIEPFGDPRKGPVKSLLRIAGFWFQKAGFNPGDRVLLEMTNPGEIVLKVRKENNDSDSNGI